MANRASNNVTVIDTASNTAVATIAVGSLPFAIAVTPDGAAAYTANAGSANVTPIATATNTTGTAIAAGNSPFWVTIAPDQAPAAAFSASVASSTASFDASASSDSDGTVASYTWDFGDGQTQTTSSPTVSHVYANPGSYTASLRVTDAENCSTTFVFTGKTASCNGSAAARVQHQVTVNAAPKAAPTLTGDAARTAKLGGSVRDTIALAGGLAPEADLLPADGPGDSDRSQPPVFTDTVTVSGNGSYSSGPFKPSRSGTYRWTAAYSGDPANTAAFHRLRRRRPILGGRHPAGDRALRPGLALRAGVGLGPGARANAPAVGEARSDSRPSRPRPRHEGRVPQGERQALPGPLAPGRLAGPPAHGECGCGDEARVPPAAGRAPASTASPCAHTPATAR